VKDWCCVVCSGGYVTGDRLVLSSGGYVFQVTAFVSLLILFNH